MIGVSEGERSRKQRLLINVSLGLDLSRVGRTDVLDDTVAYGEVAKRILEEAEKASFQLIETLAAHLGRAVLVEFSKIRQVRIEVRKPGALSFAHSVGAVVVSSRSAGLDPVGDEDRSPIVSVVGRKNSGKTTFIEKLIPAIAGRGYRVATIKHHHQGGFDLDTPGKDSWRHTRAGALATALLGTDRLVVFCRPDTKMTAAEAARTLSAVRPDIVITEGFRDGPFPKIEILRQAQGARPLCGVAEGLIAVVTDAPVQAEVPSFGLEDADGVAALLAARVVR